MVIGMQRVQFLRIAVALLGIFAVSGCTSSGVCPAIAWFNTVEVNLIGNADAVASFELCTDDVCAASTSVLLGPEEPLSLSTRDFQLGSPGPQAASPSTTAIPQMLFSSTRIDAQTWSISIDMAAPETLTFRALSSSGDVLAERAFELDWQRVGGSEECGGPSVAGPVILDIQA